MAARVGKYPPFLRLFALGTASVFGAIFIRLIDIQLLQGDTYALQADENRFFVQRVAPERGVFLDRYGEPLVFNAVAYSQIANPNRSYSEESRISREQALELLASDSAAVGKYFERTYIYPEPLAHVLGYVGPVSAEDLLEDPSLDISDRVGRMGLERAFDDQVRGSAGFDVYEVNALGEKQRLVEAYDPVSGQNVQTSLDPYLTQVAYDALGEQRGSVVILDPETGEVLSIASKPSFDPNVMSTKLIDDDDERERQRTIQSYFTHPQQLFFNRAVSGAYPPGSVFKIITALAGLENGAFNAGTTVIDEGVLKVGDFSYANWYYTQYGGVEGEIALQRAIARSNDIYFYKAAEWTGIDRLTEMARLFGLGQVTGIEIGSEAEGLVPDPAWKERVLGERWFLGNTYHFGIGQDNLLVTPLQVAQMGQIVGNRGAFCPPTLVMQSQDSPDRQCAELGITAENLEVVLQGMLDACSTGGTAFPFFDLNESRNASSSAMTQIERGAAACKTGTAEFGGPDEQGYKKTHAWFVTVVGVPDIGESEIESENSEIATASAELREEWLDYSRDSSFPKTLDIVVMVESDEENPFKEGSSEAAPVAREIVEWLRGAQVHSNPENASIEE